tara:strand:+ start:126344 stop:127174 length:831 start_codon:yes stop_codon:yes gene_type:complete
MKRPEQPSPLKGAKNITSIAPGSSVSSMGQLTSGITNPCAAMTYSRGTGKSIMAQEQARKMIAQLVSDGLAQELLEFEFSAEENPKANVVKYLLKHKPTGRMIGSSDGNVLKGALDYFIEHPFMLHKYIEQTHIENWSATDEADDYQDHKVPDFVKNARKLPAEERSDLESMAIILFNLQQRAWSKTFTQNPLELFFERYKGNPCGEVAMSGEPMETHTLKLSNNIRMKFKNSTGELTRLEVDGRINPHPKQVRDDLIEWEAEARRSPSGGSMRPV